MKVADNSIRSIQQAFEKVNEVSKKLEKPGNTPEARDIVTLISSEKQVKSNIKVIQTQDEMTKTLLDIKA